MLGFDTNVNCQSKASAIYSAGYRFAGRYYNVNDTSKNLTNAEALALSNAGIYIAALWENGYPTTASYFTYAKGYSDGTSAYNYAHATIGQPGTAPIFFAVDYDATSTDISGAITSYFQGVEAAFTALGNLYSIGVYGSGAVCAYIYRNIAPVRCTWLAQSSGWTGYSTYTSWSIFQGSAITVDGIASDGDTSDDSITCTFRI